MARKLSDPCAGSVELTAGNTPATTEVAMVLDTADAEAFDTTVCQVAAQPGRLGDHDSLDIRRARAVGILADPQAALDLFTEGETTRRTPDSSTSSRHAPATDARPRRTVGERP